MKAGRFRKQAIALLRDDTGLVTLEWVAIAAAVILLGVGVIIFLKPSVDSAASNVGTNLVNAVDSNP